MRKIAISSSFNMDGDNKEQRDSAYTCIPRWWCWWRCCCSSIIHRSTCVLNPENGIVLKWTSHRVCQHAIIKYEYEYEYGYTEWCLHLNNNVVLCYGSGIQHLCTLDFDHDISSENSFFRATWINKAKKLQKKMNWKPEEFYIDFISSCNVLEL